MWPFKKIDKQEGCRYLKAPSFNSSPLYVRGTEAGEAAEHSGDSPCSMHLYADSEMA